MGSLAFVGNLSDSQGLPARGSLILLDHGPRQLAGKVTQWGSAGQTRWLRVRIVEPLAVFQQATVHLKVGPRVVAEANEASVSSRPADQARLAKRWGFDAHARLPGDTDEPAGISADFSGHVFAVSGTLPGLQLSCVNCSLNLNPIFELDLEVGSRGWRPIVNTLRVVVGSRLAVNAVFRASMQGIASLASLSLPLHPEVTLGPLTGFPFAIGPVVGTARPTLTVNVALAVQSVGSVEATFGVKAIGQLAGGFSYERGVGFELISQAEDHVESSVTPVFDAAVAPPRKNPRARISGGLETALKVHLWEVITPSIAYRPLHGAAEWLFATDRCPNNGPAFRFSVASVAYAGLTLFGGFSKGPFSFLSLSTGDGLPFGMSSDVFPSVELTHMCLDQRDDGATNVFDVGTPRADKDASAIATALQTYTVAPAATAVARGPLQFAGAAAPWAAVLPKRPAPAVVRAQLVVPDGAAAVAANGDLVAELSVAGAVRGIDTAVRFCLASVTDEPAELASVLAQLMSDTEAAATFGSLLPSSGECEGMLTPFLAGGAAGVHDDLVDDRAVVEGVRTVLGTVSFTPSLLVALLLRETATVGVQVAIFSQADPSVKAIAPWRSVDASFVEGRADVTSPSMLHSLWEPCSADSYCNPALGEEQTRKSVCLSNDWTTTSDACPAGPTQQSRPCKSFNCPAMPLLRQTPPVFGREIFVTPGVYDVPFSGGSAFDKYVLEFRRTACPTSNELGEANEWVELPDAAAVPAASQDDAPENLMRLWLPQLPATLSAIRVRPLLVDPLDLESSCSDVQRSLVIDSVTFTSYRVFSLVVRTSSGSILKIPPALQGETDLTLTVVGGASSTTRRIVSSTNGNPSATLEWYDLDVGPINLMMVENLKYLKQNHLHASAFPLDFSLTIRDASSTQEEWAIELPNGINSRAEITIGDFLVALHPTTVDFSIGGDTVQTNEREWTMLHCERTARDTTGSKSQTCRVVNEQDEFPILGQLTSLEPDEVLGECSDMFIDDTKRGLGVLTTDKTELCIGSAFVGIRASEDDESSGLSTGVIVAIVASAVVCCLFTLIFVAVVLVMLRRRSTRWATAQLTTTKQATPLASQEGHGDRDRPSLSRRGSSHHSHRKSRSNSTSHVRRV